MFLRILPAGPLLPESPSTQHSQEETELSQELRWEVSLEEDISAGKHVCDLRLEFILISNGLKGNTESLMHQS